MEAVSHPNTSAIEPPVTWLSGEVVTVFNKIGPVIWIAAVVGLFSGIFLKTGRISVAPGFRFFVGFMIAATVFMFWLSAKVQRVGFSGRSLIVSNYLRQERVPFDSIGAVEPVWWNYRRMVRIRLRRTTSFGEVVYYIPKWAAFKCLWIAPEKELRELLARNQNEAPLYP